MNLPNVIANLLAAQNSFDNKAYADCFSENAIVYDEGKTHVGKEEIRQWNEMTNIKYRTKLESVEISTSEHKTSLTTKVSGTFSGSPILLKYHFEIVEAKINSLRITDN